MSFTKFASLESAQVLGIKSSNERIRTASLDKFADYSDFRTDDGYLYARIRAISSRVNKNHDGWPSIELAGGQDVFDRIASQRQATITVGADASNELGYSTFLGKPIFVDHNNSDPDRARGVIVDSKLHIEDHRTASGLDDYYSSAPENHLPPTWVELLLEVDAKSFPKLAKAIIDGSRDSKKGIDGFSMGCDVRYSRCNICDNKAESPHEYCDHIRMKGAYCDFTDPSTGHKTSKRSYEDCYGIKFFEISAVFDPADPTALSSEVIHEGAVTTSSIKNGTITVSKIASGGSSSSCSECGTVLAESSKRCHNCGHKRKTAENAPPQADQLKAPQDVDTLREEAICPVCGSDMEEETCEVCGYTKPPDGFDNPDLEKAKETDLTQEEGADGPKTDQDQPVPEPMGDGFGPSPQSEDTSKSPSLAHVTNDMSWEVSTPSRVAFTNPSEETPVVPGKGPVSDQPTETVVKDSPAPVTSSVRTASDFVAAAGATENRRHMSQKVADAASGAPAVATPDKNVDTDGVGGVLDATNEEASKADAQVDVLGEGGTGVEGVGADSTTSVDQGDEHSKNIEAIPTKTFDDGSSGVERQADPVGGGTFPTSDEGVKASSWEVTALDSGPWPEQDDNAGSPSGADQGVQPADPVGVADERVDVLQAVTSPNNNSGPTTTWNGTDGNGVLQQQEPVTNETLEGADIVNLKGSKTHIFAAMRLADLEVELGLVDSSRKYARVAELENENPERLIASLAYAQRIKTAGLSKGHKTARRLPSMARSASVETKEATTESEPNPDFLWG